MEVEAALEYAHKNVDYLNDWERERIFEWFEYVFNKRYSLKDGQAAKLMAIVRDLENGKKVVTAEHVDTAVIALKHSGLLKGPNELDFLSKVSKYEPGKHKLSAKERSWLHKVQGRLNKHL